MRLPGRLYAGSVEEVLETLDRMSLEMFETCIAALAARFQEVMTSAAKLLEPKVQFVQPPDAR